MPDRPAGAVEGAQDTVALETSALEAMMAAVLFRPAPAPQQTDVTPAVPVASVLRQVEITPAMAEASAPQPVDPTMASVTFASRQVDEASSLSAASTVTYSNLKPAVPTRDVGTAVEMVTLATAADALIQSEDGTVSIEAPDAASGVMRIAAQAAQRLAPARNKAGGVSTDTSDVSTFDVEASVATIGSPDDATAPAIPSAVSSAETASTPLGLLEGMSGVETVEGSTPMVRPDMRVAVPADDAVEPDLGNASARAALVSNLSPMTDTGSTVPVAATKASMIQSLPVAAQVAETVRAAVMRGDHEIRLLLNPGDLGRIDIRITEQNGVLQLRLGASHASTRDLLAREMPVLQQALEARDLRVERIQVSHSGSASADGSGAAWQQGSGRQWQQRERDGSPAWSPVANLTQSERGQQEAPRGPRVIRHHGVLDRVA